LSRRARASRRSPAAEPHAASQARSTASSTRCGSRTAWRPTRWRPTGATWRCTRSGWRDAARRSTTAARADLLAYACARHAGSKATSSNRRLTVFKRYFRWALREHLVSRPHACKLLGAGQAAARAEDLSEAQVEALLGAPEVDTPLGLRDRTMLELMYASGCASASWSA
jgi:hypothetical protein